MAKYLSLYIGHIRSLNSLPPLNSQVSYHISTGINYSTKDGVSVIAGLDDWTAIFMHSE